MARVETALEKVVTSLNTRLNNLEVPTAPLVVQLFSFLPPKHFVFGFRDGRLEYSRSVRMSSRGCLTFLNGQVDPSSISFLLQTD